MRNRTHNTVSKKSQKKETPENDLIDLPVLPLPEVVIFPNSISPLFVVRPQSLAAVENATAGEDRIFLVTQRHVETETPSPDDLYDIGTVSQILQVQRLPDNSLRIFTEGEYVARALSVSKDDKMLRATVERVDFEPAHDKKGIEALRRTVINQFETYARLSDRIPEDLFLNIKNIEDNLALTHAIGNYSAFETVDKQQLLSTTSVTEQFMLLSRIFTTENELLAMESKILSQVKSQIGKNQKEYFLNEQLKVIERELGLDNEEDREIEDLKGEIEDSAMSEEAKDKAMAELSRLSRMAPMSPESTVSRTYLEWLLDYPWNEYSEDSLDLRRAMRVLNQDHHGLDKVKERIVEYLAVLRLVKGSMRGPILCLVGPPGVGKTSLARSIARTLDRQFARFSLGGVRDEAEIRGHRRTYIGALPGKIVQLMKKAETSNPVLLLDEIDKMNADFRGDPASALLEVLDPEQNRNFNDHYMEVDLDLSRVLFITTANTTDGIPWALRDRMEIIRLAGYTRIEKLAIARNFLVPNQMKEHGLTKTDIQFPDDAIEYIIDAYTREAGVRNLEREIAAVCRKTARKIATSRKRRSFKITPKMVHDFLGPIRYQYAEIEHEPEVGSAVGLAWTEVGGEILPVEASIMPGKGNLQLTGKLGDVMQESAKAGLSYIRTRANELKIEGEFWKDKDIHIHLPEGAIPKDGPSAGITMITALVSALSGRPVRQDLAMTGEVTLRGKVLKIGGLKEKAIAAHRAKIKEVLIPVDNKEDLIELPSEVKCQIKFKTVRTVDEVLKIALLPAGGKTQSKGRKGRKPRSTVTRRRQTPKA